MPETKTPATPGLPLILSAEAANNLGEFLQDVAAHGNHQHSIIAHRWLVQFGMIAPDPDIRPHRWWRDSGRSGNVNCSFTLVNGRGDCCLPHRHDGEHKLERET